MRRSPMNDLEELKTLLFGAEKQALDSITERVQKPETRAVDIADRFLDASVPLLLQCETLMARVRARDRGRDPPEGDLAVADQEDRPGLPRPKLILERGELASIPGHRSAYQRDGRVLDLPVEKAPPREPHAEPHWFPVLLRTMQAVRAEQS